MFGDKELLIQRLYHEESLRQAEKDRLVRRILAAKRSGNRRHRALGWLGSRLVAWGQDLQERYDAPVAAAR